MAKKRKRVFPAIMVPVPRIRDMPDAPGIEAISFAVFLMNNGDVAKVVEDIRDTDRCQRGRSGKPLGTVTSGVPYLTRKEWEVRHAVET
jgi:hypothetical protein